jgi:hypothetical protein
MTIVEASGFGLTIGPYPRIPLLLLALYLAFSGGSESSDACDTYSILSLY